MASLLVAVIGYALDAQVVLAVGGLLATGVGISWWLVVDGVDEIQTGRVPRILARQAAEYLVEIEYADRPEPRGSHQASDGRPNYWATGTYDPDRFSRIRGSHAQYELDAMRNYGMTADEWDANRPD